MPNTLLSILLMNLTEIGSAITVALLIGFALYYIANTPTVQIGGWHHAFDSFDYSPDEVYKAVRASIEKREIPGIRFDQIMHMEKSLLGAWRAYLRVYQGHYYMDICAVPFAKGFYISWRLFEQKTFTGEMLRKFPKFAELADRQTYYEQDTQAMVREYLHKSVLETIDGLMTVQGLRSLSDAERSYDSRKAVLN